MLVSQKLNDALNEEIGLEFFADFQYLAMATYFEERGFSRLGKFFYDQAAEEREHGLKIIAYLNQAGGKAVIPSVKQPRSDFKSVEELAQTFLEQEQSVTRNFYRMVEMSLTEKDYATFNFLQWFIAEQLEEEATAGKLLQLAKTFGEDRIFQIEMMVGNMDEE
jgi:ferritin